MFDKRKITRKWYSDYKYHVGRARSFMLLEVLVKEMNIWVWNVCPAETVA